MSELAQTVDKAYEKAKKLNLDVVVPDEYTLQLDFDSTAVPYTFDFIQLLNYIDTNFGIDSNETVLPDTPYYIKETISKSGNKHVYIKLKVPVSAAERIALQAALGSDPKREILSLARLKRGELTPTLLFEVKKPENTLSSTGQTGYERV